MLIVSISALNGNYFSELFQGKFKTYPLLHICLLDTKMLKRDFKPLNFLLLS